MKTLLLLGLFAFLPLLHAADPNCEAGLGSSWVTQSADRQVFIAKILEHTGEGKLFEYGVDSGNVGMRAYILPSDRTVEILKIASLMRRPQNIPYAIENFDPLKNKVVGILETDDEPLMTFVMFTKGEAQAGLIAKHLNAVDEDENEALQALVPSSMKDGHFDSFPLIHALLHEGEELSLSDHEYSSSWTIEAYK